MVEHKDVAAIWLTGSVGTGRRIAAACVAADPMKKMQLEMGGKNPTIVLDDADLKVAVECSVNSAFSYLRGGARDRQRHRVRPLVRHLHHQPEIRGHFKRNSEAGMVMGNLPTAGVDYHVPFGGRKGSSYGPRARPREVSPVPAESRLVETRRGLARVGVSSEL